MANDEDAQTGSNLPVGLELMIAAFIKGCDANGKRAAPEVVPEMIKRFEGVFLENEQHWKAAGRQVLTVAGVSGRLAAMYAILDGSPQVEWHHARYGLRDGQIECRVADLPRGKHCQNVDLGLP